MKALTPVQADAFRSTSPVAQRFNSIARDQARRIVETDAGARNAIARTLSEYLLPDESSEAYIEITDWGVWPSSDNPDLFYAYRKCLGEARLLGEAHFHVFTYAEADQLRNLLNLAMIFFYNVQGVSSGTEFKFFASHDEWIDVYWPVDAPWKDLEWLFED